MEDIGLLISQVAIIISLVLLSRTRKYTQKKLIL
jgi:hypothetical protein